MEKSVRWGVVGVLFALWATQAQATFVGAVTCSGAVSCQGPDATYPIPNPISQDPNNGVLLIWNEQQNVVLTRDLAVDRVADASASYVGGTAGNHFIKAGTIVSSHYVQWDPLGSSGTVDARLQFDSDIFAFITADAKLFSSDAILGLTGYDYSDFSLRGLESGDTTSYPFAPTDYSFVDVHWTASSPGDWTRLITAFSPSAVPLPPSVWLLLAGLLLTGLRVRRS